MPWCSALAAALSAVYFQGRFLAAGEEARVAITDRGYLLGEGVFATLRGYDGACFRPQRHLATLARGAELFGLTLPVGVERLVAIADEAASRTRVREAYVRVTLTRGADDDHPVLSVISRPLEVPSAADYAQGIAAAIVTPRRIPPECLDPSVKMTSYGAQVLAKRDAAARGVGEGEGLMLAVDGSLACGTMANVFLIKDGALLTPPITSGCRAGITREAVLEIAVRAGLRAREERLDLDALFDADEAFFTSSRVECLPIATVDGKRIGKGGTGEGASGMMHPRTAELRATLRALVLEETTIGTISERRGIA